MEQKPLSKQEILKEIEKVLDLYNEDIVGIGYSINFTFKDYNSATIMKNYHVACPSSIGECRVV